MKLSAQSIKEFQEIYLKDYGVSLSEQEATDLALELAGLMNAIYKPIPKNVAK